MMRDFTQPSRPASPEADPRVIPHNIEAEQALLGAILLHNDAFFAVNEIVEERHFFEPLHQRVFDALRKVIGGGRVATAISLKPFFDNEKPIPIGASGETITVPGYLGRLTARATSIINARDYAQTIRDLHDRRQLIEIGEIMVDVAFHASPDYPPQRQVEEAEARLFDLAQTNPASTYANAAGVWANLATDMAQAAFSRDTGLVGISTGFATLDRDLGGLAPSDLIILAGRPGMGKSSLAACIAFNAAKAFREEAILSSQSPGEVAFYSLEMSGEQLMMRQLAQDTNVTSSRIREGRISEDDLQKVIRAGQRMGDLPLWVDCQGALPLGTLMARARRRKRTHNTKLIIIDYLQLMTSGERTENRVVEITKITSGLKAMAKELNVPVIALSQLSRAVETREDKRPQLADLRESGSIEQDADIVLFVYRGEYYFTRANPRPPDRDPAAFLEWEAEAREAGVEIDVAEIIRAKHRHGSTGTTKLKFIGRLTRFEDMPASAGM